MLSEFFHSVFSSKVSFHIEHITIMNPTLTNFSVSTETFHELIATLDPRKARGSHQSFSTKLVGKWQSLLTKFSKMVNASGNYQSDGNCWRCHQCLKKEAIKKLTTDLYHSLILFVKVLKIVSLMTCTST